jgi:hypothetical protein
MSPKLNVTVLWPADRVTTPTLPSPLTSPQKALTLLPHLTRMLPHFGQIFQITPVPGICTSAASAPFLNPASGSERPIADRAIIGDIGATVGTKPHIGRPVEPADSVGESFLKGLVVRKAL